MMGSKQKTAAKNSSVVPDSEKSIIDSTSSPPNDSLNARTRLQEKEKLGGLNDRLAIYMERVRSLETENARLHIQVRESELIEKSTVRGVEKQYESKISQLRNEFEAISRDKAKLEMEQSKTADACKDMRSAAERLKIEIKVAEKHIGDDYGRMQDLKATLRDRKGHCELAEKELQTLKKEEEGCKKEIGTIRNQLDNEVLLRKDLQNKLATYKDDLEFTRCNSNKAFEEFRSKRQSEMNLFSAEVENRYQAKLQDQLQTMRADFDHRIAESRAEVDARYQGKLAKAKEDDDRSRENALKAKQESARYRLKMEELEKAYAENNIDVNALNSKIVELENSLRYLSEFNDVRLQERDEKILEMEASLNAMMEEFRSLMDVKVQLDTELLAYQKLLEGEEIRLNIIAGKGGLSSPPLCSTPQEDSLPGVIQPTLRRHAKRRRFNDSLEVSQIQKTYTSKSGAIGPLTVQEIGTDGSFIRIRNTGDTVCAIGGWKIVSTAGLKEVSYRFRANQTIGPNETLAVWSNGADPMDKFESHLSMKNQIWPTDVAIKAVLQNADGVVVAWRDSILEHQVEENEEIA